GIELITDGFDLARPGHTLMVARILEKALGDLGFSPSSSEETTFSFLPRKGSDDLRFSALMSFLASPLVAPGTSFASAAAASAGSASRGAEVSTGGITGAASLLAAASPSLAGVAGAASGSAFFS